MAGHLFIKTKTSAQLIVSTTTLFKKGGRMKKRTTISCRWRISWIRIFFCKKRKWTIYSRFFVVGEQKMEKGHIWTVGELFHYWYFFIIIVKRLFDFPHYRLTGFFYCLFSLSRMYYYYFIELKRPWFIFNNIVSTDYMQLCKLESCLEIWLILFQLTPKNNEKKTVCRLFDLFR